jgi:hypothetical protein
MKLLFNILVLSALGCVGLRAETTATTNDSTNRPLLAIWRDNEGLRLNSEAPYLRIAIWNDRRIVFAKDASKWNHELLEGRIEAARMDELKKAIEKTGVFELKGNCYLVPDAPVDCVMLDFGRKKQMLYWDEREQPGYGINIAPKEHHLKFMSCWKEVNRLALEAIPKDSQPHGEKFQRPPQSWRLKKPIQSE